MFVPPTIILVGGVVFGSLAPVLGGFFGALLVSAATAAAALGAGTAVCRGVDRAARHWLARQRRLALPEARVLLR
jgi:hypothetical protein